MVLVFALQSSNILVECFVKLQSAAAVFPEIMLDVPSCLLHASAVLGSTAVVAQLLGLEKCLNTPEQKSKHFLVRKTAFPDVKLCN